MIKLTEKTINQLYKLDNIVRYNTAPKHKNETVAAHSFYTTLFAMMLCDELSVHDYIRRKAIQFALIHDIPEIIINDITHDAKQMMPEIVPILDKYEKAIINDNFPFIYNSMSDESQGTVFAKLIVDLADTISVLQFVLHEKMMGNQEVAEWVVPTKNRIEKIKKEIERLGYSCQEIMI